MPNRLAKARAVGVHYGQQGDLIVEGDKAFDYHLARSGAAAFLGVLPSLFNIGSGFYRALAFAG